MAKQVNYTHPNGTEYPESYWRITSLDVDVPNRIAKFTFTGYKDASAREVGKSPIDSRLVIITNEDFDSRFQEVTLKEKNPQEIGYEYCSLYKDVPTKETVTMTIPNENGEDVEITQEIDVNVSFFKDALDV